MRISGCSKTASREFFEFLARAQNYGFLNGSGKTKIQNALDYLGIFILKI